MPLTPDVVQAAWNASLSAVVGRLNPTTVNRKFVSIALQGPSASTLRIYRGYKIDAMYLMSSVFPADSRLYDSVTDAAPMCLFSGEAATFAWTGGASGIGVTAIATVTSQWGRN